MRPTSVRSDTIQTSFRNWLPYLSGLVSLLINTFLIYDLIKLIFSYFFVFGYFSESLSFVTR